MYNYVSLRILIFFVLILAVMIIISYSLSGIQKMDLMMFLKIFLFELPVASTSAIIIVYTFFLTEDKISSLGGRNLISAFMPSVLFVFSIVAIVIVLQEIVMPTLVKQKLYQEGVKDVIFAFDNNRYFVVDNVGFNTNKNVFVLRNVDVVSKKGFSILGRYSALEYDHTKNVLKVGSRQVELNGNLEKVFLFFVDRNYFFSVWEFNNVKDSFFVFDLKTSFINFVMYEKIFMPVISFVIMVFAITLGWRWRISRPTKLLPLLIVVGAVLVPIGVKMIFYLSVRIFEFLVFPF